MQVVRGEAAECLQPFHIQDDEVLARQRDQPIPAQALENPAHVYVRQAHGVAQLLLGYRQLVLSAVRQSHNTKP